MKWFKHRTDASESGEFLRELESIFGLPGYARWFKLLEKVGYRMDKTDLCSAAYPWSDWQTLLRGKRKKLETFLEHCQNKGKISYVSTGNILEIEIPNLLAIRDNHSKNLQATCKRLASKEVYKEELDKEVDKEVKTSCPKSDAKLLESKLLADFFLSHIRTEGLFKPSPNLKKWAKEIDKILRIDKRDKEELEKVIIWATHDDFWRKNIRSPVKLREHYERLNVERKTDGGKNKTGGRGAFVDGDRKTREDYGLD